MSIEDNFKTDEQKIKALLEEAAKRHREIEQKIHYPNKEEDIAELKKEQTTGSETIVESDKNNAIIDNNNSEKEIPETIKEPVEKVNDLIETIAVAEKKPVEEIVKESAPEPVKEIKEPEIKEKTTPEIISNKIVPDKEVSFKFKLKKSDEPDNEKLILEKKSVLEAIELIISKHRNEKNKSEIPVVKLEPAEKKESIEKIKPVIPESIEMDNVSDAIGSKTELIEELEAAEEPETISHEHAKEITVQTEKEYTEIPEKTKQELKAIVEMVSELKSEPVNDIKNEELIEEYPVVIFEEPVIEKTEQQAEQTEQVEVKEQTKEPVINSETPVFEKTEHQTRQAEQVEQTEQIKEPVTESKSEEIIIPVEETIVEKIIESPVITEKFITDYDLYLISNGTHYKIYDKLGAHLTTLGGIEGVNFAVWAPNAETVYVIGEFNGWKEAEPYRMEKLNDYGIWSLFIPSLKKGDSYKYSIKSWVDGAFRRKADPYAFQSEVRPKNASIVSTLDSYEWNDSNWMKEKESSGFKDKPMNIYEVHLGSWRRDWGNKEFPNEWGYLSYGQLAKEIVDYAKKMGYTHIELLPVMEHPLDISWGYQVTHYYAPTSRFGSPDDFKYFVDHCHQNGIGVILDWVPAHFPYDDHALAFFDGRQIYAYENVKRGIHKDWGTYIFDYGKAEVQNFLIGSALFWLEKYHADGLRVDAVASMLYLDYSRNSGEWEPNIHGGREHLEAIAFIKHLNEKVHELHKGAVMIAEESTSWPGVSHPVSQGGLGFDMKWNMGWMNDTLLYFSKDPVYRKFHQGKITFSLWYAFSENFILPISHDEIVHGKKSLLEKMPGDNWQKFANLRLFFGFMLGHPGKKLNFMTSDIAQYNEWNCEVSVDWNLLDVDLNKKLNRFVKDLNNLYKVQPALFEVDFTSDGFHWIDFSDSLHSIISFIRTSKDKKETLLFTFNMTPTVRYDYTIGVPEAGFWKEILNSDADIYGGSGVGNMGGKQSEQIQVKEWQNSIRVNLPPLAVNVFKLDK